MALYLHGYDHVAMYDGSWTEWHQEEANPRDEVETMLARSPVQ
jgi:3-mercaptopyruvate sulfurtransferase SseA